MKEEEVNKRVKVWLEERGYTYKGVLKNGDVPVPDGKRDVLIDAHGIQLVNKKGDVLEFEEGKGYKGDDNTKDYRYETIWVEGKGENANFSELLEGFVRTLYAVWHGKGIGLLAVPSDKFELLMEEKEFLEHLSEVTVGKGCAGLMNVETNEIFIL